MSDKAIGLVERLREKADYHDNKATEAEAFDAPDSAKYHDEHRLLLIEAADALSALPPLRAREEIARALSIALLGDDVEWQAHLSLADRFTAALSSTAGQEWRDISSAPKDGTKIILYNEKWETFPLASWEWGEGPDEDGTGGWCAWHTADDRFPGAEDGIIYPSENYMPTHWLPAPPVAEPLLAEKSQS